MRTVTVYHIATGEIARVISGPERSVAAKLARIDVDRFATIEGRPANQEHQCVADGQFAERPVSNSEAMALLRAERNRRLSETDWTQLRDVPQATRKKWREYRQALRDVTKGDPFAPVWPERPE